MHTVRNNRGFSLIEILVVMAISVILVGLIMYPLAHSFRLTREAQAMADAQDSARRGMEIISRDIGEAMFVFDNSTAPVNVFSDGSTPSFNYHSGPESPVQLPVRQPDGSIECFTLPYGKLDFILPKVMMHCNNPEHDPDKPRDYPRYVEETDANNKTRRYWEAWPPCPVCGSTNVDARPKFPLEQDVTVVRYFLGLRYNDPTVNPTTVPIDALGPNRGWFGWQTPYAKYVEPDEENQVVLYRVEFDPHDDTLFPERMPISDRLADPIFFYRSATNSEGIPCCQEWAQRARVVGIGKYQDLVVGTFDDNNKVTAVEPTVTFRFSAIDNDTFSGTYSQDKSFDVPDPIPTVYQAAYGYWTRADGITVYRYGDQKTDAFTTEYRPVGGAQHLIIVKRSSDDSWQSEEEQFDITQYLEDLENDNLTAITKPNSSEPPEMAFYTDYVVVPGSGSSSKTVVITPNRGKVYFSLIPPKLSKGRRGPVERFDPFVINDEFHAELAANRSPWPRMVKLNLPPNARVVPGSVRVVGPDMTPGAVGNGVTYKPVALQLRSPGLNEYRVDYDTGYIYFSRDPGVAYDIPVLPDPSGQGGNLPVMVDYRIQFNKDGDVVKGDYVTKSLVTVHLGMRMFDPDSAKPHSVDLTNSIKVRNALR